MADPWPKGSSPTGRGYTQGSDSYRADDVERICKEEAAFQERKRQRQAVDLKPSERPSCPYCGNAPFGMDVDRCPIHGIGCA